MRRPPPAIALLAALALVGCSAHGAEPTAEPSTAATEPQTSEQTAEPTTKPTTTEPEPTEEITPLEESAAPEEVIFYIPQIEVQSAADVTMLVGAPPDFHDFVAAQFETAGSQCPLTVWVDAVDPTGLAAGGVEECGGAAQIWQRNDGGWSDVAGAQDLFACEDLSAAGVPVELLAGPEGNEVDCLGADGVETYAG